MSSSSDTCLPLTEGNSEKLVLVTPSNHQFELPEYSKAASIHSCVSKSRTLTRSLSRATRSTSRLSIKKGYDSDEETTCGWDQDDDTISVLTAASNKPTRLQLEKSLGQDAIMETMETNKMPCAGVKIAVGPLRGLMAWRLVVQLDDPRALYRAPSPGTVVNFILDSGSRHNIVPPQALRLLGLSHVPESGTPIKLIIHGVHTSCIVGTSSEAGRLCTQYMMDGSLGFYFDTRLSAPVLYRMDLEREDAPHVNNIQRTVQLSLREKVVSLIFGHAGGTLNRKRNSYHH